MEPPRPLVHTPAQPVRTPAPTPESPRPLADLTVLDLTVALAGPFATLLLAGLGARVIKIESRGALDTSRDNAPYLGAEGLKLSRDRDDDVSISALNRLRNKLGVTLDLKHPRSRGVFADLLRKADVVVENFSSGTLERLGAGYDASRAINPRIVYCSITGFGRDAEGPSKAMDASIQALCGVMHVSGRPDEPPSRIGLPLADLVTPLFGVIGVLSAVHMARRTGVGQCVDVSMLGSMTALVASEAFDALEQLGVPLRTGETVPRLAPFGLYATADGYVSICAPTDRFVTGLFRAMAGECPELVTDPRFLHRDQRVRNSVVLDALVGAWTRRFTTREVLAKLEQQEVPATEVRDPRAAVRDPRVVARGESVPLAHPAYGAVGDVYGMGMPIRFSDAVATFDRPPPAPGQDNEEVYGGLLGYSHQQLVELRARGVI
jgi:crotonobetainyl-CoA:carnitine CoA-transferase CaiB-like acyl-CoA transferase